MKVQLYYISKEDCFTFNGSRPRVHHMYLTIGKDIGAGQERRMYRDHISSKVRVLLTRILLKNDGDSPVTFLNWLLR